MNLPSTSSKKKKKKSRATVAAAADERSRCLQSSSSALHCTTVVSCSRTHAHGPTRSFVCCHDQLMI
jgi:hypothetical protein